MTTMAALAPATTEVSAAWRVLPGAIMLVGQSSRPVPATGVAQVQFAPASRGAFRALSWPVGRDHAFVAAVRLPDRTDPRYGASLLVRGAGGEGLTLVLPDTIADATFGQHVAQHAAQHAAAVARFMLDTLRPTAKREVPGVATMLRAFLSHAAPADGHVEIMAAIPGSCVLLQGWGGRVTGAVQVLLAGTGLPIFAAHAGEFARTDTAAPATGTMLALPPEAAPALPCIDHVFILSEHGLHSRTVADAPLLDPAASLGHVRHMLPSLRCPQPMQAMLREALRARYEGHDTLTGNPHPVRTAVDFAAAAAGVGVYVSGWVFDPAHLLAELHICGPDGCARLDTAWTRIPRPDVIEAFRTTPGFPHAASADAGFAAFVAAPDLASGLHLRFTFTDGERAFMPLTPVDPTDAAIRTRLLAGVDLYKPSGLPVLRDQVAPLLARIRPAPAQAPHILLRGPVERPHAVVVPLPTPDLPRAVLAGLLHDPLLATEQLVLVCGTGWDTAGLDALQATIRFYAVPATILLTDAPAGPVAALHAAAAATTAETLLLMRPSATGGGAGWRAALRRAAGTRAFACPTVLYEDWSIRYAGSAAIVMQDAAPYTHAHAPLAGMPAALALGQTPVPAVLGSLDCCLMGRAALAALDGPGALSTDAGQEAAAFLRLRAAGLDGVWVPSVQVYAPEAAQDDGRAGALVDGWVLRLVGAS